MKTPMTKSTKRLMMIMGVFIFSIFFSYPASAFTEVTDGTTTETIVPKKKSSGFTWGAEFGTSIDMSGYDSSTFNIDAMAGYRNPSLQILGIGVGIHRSVGSGDNYVPIYALVRTSFSSRPRLVFMSAKAGYSFNTIGDSSTFGDINASLGAGINLAQGKTFKSYIILAYEFRHFNKRHKSEVSIDADDISLVSLSFGVNF